MRVFSNFNLKALFSAMASVTAQAVRSIWLRRGLILRGFICWAIGIVFLQTDETKSYDFRLQLRGQQTASTQFIIMRLPDPKITGGQRSARSQFLPEDLTMTPWNDVLWKKVLSKALAVGVRSVGIVNSFPEAVYPPPSQETLLAMQDSHIVWAQSRAQIVNHRLEASYRPFSRYGSVNAARDDFPMDEDGLVRRFQFAPGPPHLAERLVTSKGAGLDTSKLLNFRGPGKSIPKISVDEFLKLTDPKSLKNKILLIEYEPRKDELLNTPMGPMSLAEVTAQAADNILHDRWVARIPDFSYALYLLLILLISALLIANYPPTIASAGLVWLALLIGTISVGVFDTWHFWLPIISPLTVMVTTWIVFVGHQAYAMERRSWRLEQERVALKEMEEMKNNFVSLISHDLKTPIAKIQSITERLKSSPQSDGTQKELENLGRCTDELHRYIQSILQLLRVEAQDLRLNYDVCDINTLIEEVVQQLNPIAQVKDIRIETRLEPIFTIDADPTLIREVIMNILENAIKYSADGSKIEVTSQEFQDQVEVAVIDQGRGISKEEIASVWDRFYRGSAEKAFTSGSGLGLYLVKYFVELHGGRVGLQSQVGRGTQVIFTLPLEAKTKRLETENGKDLA